MVDRAMIFNTQMVMQIIAGAKTQTRRLLRPQPAFDTEEIRATMVGSHAARLGVLAHMGVGDLWKINPGIGDRIWVREAWADLGWFEPSKVAYRAGHSENNARGPRVNKNWSPSVHMPRWASRITLTVTDVRVQRLQKISEENARAEGITSLPSGRFFCGHDDEGEITSKSAITAYANLWNGLHGEGAWVRNPWVTALSFTVALANIDAVPKPEAA